MSKSKTTGRLGDSLPALLHKGRAAEGDGFPRMTNIRYEWMGPFKAFGRVPSLMYSTVVLKSLKDFLLLDRWLTFYMVVVVGGHFTVLCRLHFIPSHKNHLGQSHKFNPYFSLFPLFFQFSLGQEYCLQESSA